MAGNPFRASQMAFVSAASTIGLRDRVDAKNNTRDFLPIGAGFFRIEKTRVGDGVLLVIRHQHLLIRSCVCNFRIKRRHA